MMKYYAIALFIWAILFIGCFFAFLSSCLRRMQLFRVDKTIPKDKVHFMVIKKQGESSEQLSPKTYWTISLGKGHFLFILPRLKECHVKIFRGLMGTYSEMNKTTDKQKKDIATVESATKNGNKKFANLYNTTCMICLDDFDLDDQLFLIACGHSFHLDCAAEFFTKDCSTTTTCPYCKAQVDSVVNSIEETTNLMRGHLAL